MVGHGKGLHKFGETVSSNQDVLVASRCLREGADNVNVGTFLG